MNNKFKRILNNVLNHIADFYLYFLAFYVVSLIFSLFFESWKLFFYWPAFHLSAIVFGVLSLYSEKGKEVVRKFQLPNYKIPTPNKFQIKNFEFPKIKRPSFDFNIKVPAMKIYVINFAELLFYFLNYFINKFFALLTRIGLAFYDAAKAAFSILRIAIVLAVVFLAELFKVFIKFFYTQINKMSQTDFVKIGLMGVILAFTLFKGIDVVNFLILAYGLMSVLFIMESRISALMALAFLIFTPVFLIIGSSSFAEKMAVFAYYFLIIAVATQIREYFREERFTRQNFKEI